MRKIDWTPYMVYGFSSCRDHEGVRRLATVADHHGRYTLHKVALSVGIYVQGEVGVGMRINESGGDKFARSID